MRKPKVKTFYQQKLPHLQPMAGQFFVTFNLYGAILVMKLHELKSKYEVELEKYDSESLAGQEEIYKASKKYFANVDSFLDRSKKGNHFLKKEEAAQIVIDELRRFDKGFYDLKAFCVMSNHVHILIDTAPYQKLRLDGIMKRIKGPTGVYLNRLLKMEGRFWERESYDHLVRNAGEFYRIVKYILENPVKANLVRHWDEFNFSYCSGDVLIQLNGNQNQ